MKLDPKKIEIPSKDTYKLDSILAAAKSVGDPQFGRKTILVAGTNGKGSTCNYLTHLFLKTGLKVGTYTSPHLIHPTERIRVNGKSISKFELGKYEKKFAKILVPLSYFERFTLIAFLFFRDQKVDLQILEVGIGGRLDATNISLPNMSVITRIDFDHQEVLGPTLERIAREKAGIMRKATPVFISEQQTGALKCLIKHSEKLGAPLHHINNAKFSLSIDSALTKIQKLRGLHQKQNASLALSVFQSAKKEWNLSISEAEVRSALFADLPPARIQSLRKKPPFIIDGSHNENSIAALTEVLGRQFRTTRFQIVFGAMNDKPAKKMLEALRPWAKKFYFGDFNSDRQTEPAELLKLNHGVPSEIVPKLAPLVLKLWSERAPVLIAGSLYLAGEVLSILEKKGIQG